MPGFKKIDHFVQFSVERFDGGLNTKDAPSLLSPLESPDCRNVVFDDQGAVKTRDGSSQVNTTAIASVAINGLASFNNSMVAWASSSMWYLSGTTWTVVTAACGNFSSGASVAFVTYQNLLFMSDGTNGPWKYSDPDNFYNMGIDIASAPTSRTAGAGSLATNSYFYKVSFVNTQVVEGEAGSASAGVTLTTSGSVTVQSIPVGSALAGVARRKIYRATGTATAPYGLIATISDNSTVTYTDTVDNTAVGVAPITDGSKPNPFTTIELHKERLFMDDGDDRTLLRYTEFENPFISKAASFIPLNKGDKKNITCIKVQNDLVSVFKPSSIWLVDLVDPSNDVTWQTLKIPGNVGIVGPKALAEIPNGILFIGRMGEKISGMHLLTGGDLLETQDEFVKSINLSEKIEDEILAIPAALYGDIAMVEFKNQILISAGRSGSTTQDHIFWLDLNRVGTKGQPGSWSIWNGIKLNNFAVHSGDLYGGSSQANGFIYKLFAGAYSDSGTAINAYFWTKELGGEEAIESWIKDFRYVNLWYNREGAWYMNVRYRLDGDTSDGVAIPVDLTPGGSVWNTLVWGSGSWGGTRTNVEAQLDLGGIQGRRLQLRFDNQNTAGQSFKVNAAKLLMILRRQTA